MKIRFFLLSLLFLFSAGANGFGALPAPDPDDGGIVLPPGFRALVVADDLVVDRKIGRDPDKIRFLAVAPNGDLYVKTHGGGILAMRDTKGTGRFDLKEEFGKGGGTGLAFHDGWLYSSTDSSVYRYKYTPGQLVPAGEPEIIVEGLPNEKNTHNAKTFAFDDQGQLLVEVGSPYNVFSDPDRQLGAKGLDATEFLKTHGGFWRFDPNKPHQKQTDGFHFSTGHRHSIALAWNEKSKNFFNLMMGRDQLNTVDPAHYDDLDNAERVSEEMHLLKEGVDLGWPYTYYDPFRKARMVAPEFGGDNQKRVEPGKYDQPVIAFPAHWAPLQMTFYSGTQFPEKYRGGAFIAFHGSWNRAPRPQEGYNISFVPFDDKGLPVGEYEVFAKGFPQKENFTATRDAKYRPGGVAVGPDGSLYVSDTERGRIWRIIYTGEGAREDVPKAAVVRSAVPVATNPQPKVSAKGRALFAQTCAVCHMPDGTGVSNLQPSLVDSATVKGDPTLLINLVLKGPAAVLPADRAKYANVMPAFAAALDDNQVADILSFVRQSFGGGASAISATQVAAERSKVAP